MFRISQLHGFNAAYNEVSLTFTDSDNLADFSSPASTPTFSNMAIGTASSSRYVYVVYGYRNDGGLSSVTIGGIAATEVATSITGGIVGEDIGCSIWYALVPTGTTATCVFAHTGGTIESPLLVVYTATGVGLPVYATDEVTAIGTVANGGPLVVPAGGAVIGGVYLSSNRTTTWSGLSEDADFAVGAPNAAASTASLETRTGTSSLAFSATASDTAGISLVAVVISPRTA